MMAAICCPDEDDPFGVATLDAGPDALSWKKDTATLKDRVAAVKGLLRRLRRRP